MKKNIIKGIAAGIGIAALSLVFIGGSFNKANRYVASDKSSSPDLEKFVKHPSIRMIEKEIKAADIKTESIGPTIENAKKEEANKAKEIVKATETKNEAKKVTEVKKEETKSSTDTQASSKLDLPDLLKALKTSYLSLLKDSTKDASKEEIKKAKKAEKELLGPTYENWAKEDPAGAVKELKAKIVELEKKNEKDKKEREESTGKEIAKLQKEVKDLKDTNDTYKAKHLKGRDLVEKLRELFGEKQVVIQTPAAPATDNSALMAVLNSMQESNKMILAMVQKFSTSEQKLSEVSDPFATMEKTFSMMQKFGIGSGFSTSNQPIGQQFAGPFYTQQVANYPRHMINPIINSTGYNFTQTNTRPL